MKLRRLLTLALAAAFVFVAPMTAKADTTEETGWKQNDKGWWYEYGVDENGTTLFYTDGVYPIDDPKTEDVEEKYYFNKEGYMQTGWIYHTEEGTGYTYDENGNKVEYANNYSYWLYADAKGVIQTGWEQIGGNWYYFNSWGQMYEDGTRGIWEGEGEDAKEVLYHFSPSGEMTTGWYYHWNEDYGYGSWYYSASNGAVYTGWQNLGGAWYYFDNNTGAMAERERIYDNENDVWYWFRADGTMVTGWHNYAGSNSIYGNWVYCNADGTAYDGWLYSGGAWYYLVNGDMITDKYICVDEYKDADGNTVTDVYYEWGAYGTVANYYVGRDGKMITGWYNASSKSVNSSNTAWMYANADGTITEQWVKSGNDWYFIDSWGDMVADRVEYCVVEGEKSPQREDYTSWDEYYAALSKWQDAHYYVFDASGKMLTNTWYTSENSNGTNWYYADANGNGHNGWVQTKGLWYYCVNGVMQRNTYVEGGYWVNADGVWVQ